MTNILFNEFLVSKNEIESALQKAKLLTSSDGKKQDINNIFEGGLNMLKLMFFTFLFSKNPILSLEKDIILLKTNISHMIAKNTSKDFAKYTLMQSDISLLKTKLSVLEGELAQRKLVDNLEKATELFMYKATHYALNVVNK
ncbi:MAG: hypothetical protein RR489_04145 [Clostridia bacterium]